MVSEANLKQTDAGLVPAGAGWFVMNVRDARWFRKPGQGHSTPLTGNDEFEAESYFPMLGMAPETRHVFVGAGERPCVILAASSRQFQKDGPWGYYCVDETAARYNASSPQETQDGSSAYARFPPEEEIRYPGGLLPGD